MRELKVKSSRDLGPQFNCNPHRMVGQDGAYSIPLSPGKSLWFFGDTLVGERVPGESLWYPGGERLGPGDMSGHGSIEKLFTNTAAIVSGTSARDGLQNFHYVTDGFGALRQLVPRQPDELPDEIRVWCFHGILLGTQLFLYYQTVRMLADGPMPVNFEIIGSGLSMADANSLDFTRIDVGMSCIWWGSEHPQFGCAVVSQPDGFIYVYGVRKNDAGTQQCYLARVREYEIANHTRYEYLAGRAPEWSRDIRQAIPIMENMPNEMSVSWNAHLGCFLAVHSYDLSGRIVGRTSNSLWGPWSPPVDLWVVKPPDYDYPVPYAPLIYAGKEHPELASENGRVLYITYIEFEEYFPHLVEVTLA